MTKHLPNPNTPLFMAIPLLLATVAAWLYGDFVLEFLGLDLLEAITMLFGEELGIRYSVLLILSGLIFSQGVIGSVALLVLYFSKKEIPVLLVLGRLVLMISAAMLAALLVIPTYQVAVAMMQSTLIPVLVKPLSSVALNVSMFFLWLYMVIAFLSLVIGSIYSFTRPAVNFIDHSHEESTALGEKVFAFFKNHATALFMILPVGTLGTIFLFRGTYTYVLTGMYPETYFALDEKYMGQLIEAFKTESLILMAFSVLLIVTSFAIAFLKSNITLKLIRFSTWASYALAAASCYLGARIIGLADSAANPEGQLDVENAFFLFVVYMLLPTITAIWMYCVHLFAQRRTMVNAFTSQAIEEPAQGDLRIEKIRTFGKDKRYTGSSYSSVFFHCFIVIGPLILSQCDGCGEDYVPVGDTGQPVQVQVVVVKKKKKKKQLILSNLPIALTVPDLDDSKIDEQLNEQTQRTHDAKKNSITKGNIGEGDGKKGGWGGQGGPFRFIRVQYNGAGWDDGFGKARGNSDYNVMLAFQREGFEIRNRAEKNTISMLGKYRQGYAPPFVYMTGDGNISLSQGEIKTMRDFLLKGGSMLFADAGSRRWHGSFRALMKRMFPAKQMRVISRDDPIFQSPNNFPNGSPPFFAHGGSNPMGIKHEGRWVVVYHPGDIGDIWEDGHSGVDQDLVDKAFELSVNIIAYANSQYQKKNRKYQKKK